MTIHEIAERKRAEIAEIQKVNCEFQNRLLVSWKAYKQVDAETLRDYFDIAGETDEDLPYGGPPTGLAKEAWDEHNRLSGEAFAEYRRVEAELEPARNRSIEAIERKFGRA